MTVEKCLDCGCDEGTLLKEFQEQPNKSWSWYELAEMTQVCVSCGSENIERKKQKNKRQAGSHKLTDHGPFIKFQASRTEALGKYKTIVWRRYMIGDLVW